jgi:hypothetical protein
MLRLLLTFIFQQSDFLLGITFHFHNISFPHRNLFTFEKEKGTRKNTENNPIEIIRPIDTP